MGSKSLTIMSSWIIALPSVVVSSILTAPHYLGNSPTEQADNERQANS